MDPLLREALDNNWPHVIEALLEDHPGLARTRGLLREIFFHTWPSTECLQPLLNAGADVMDRDESGCTPLHYVVRERFGQVWENWSANDEETVALLLAAGAALEDDKNTYGWPPLMAAVFDGSASGVKALLKAGADPNETSAGPGGQYDLMCMAISEPRKVRALLDAGANPNFINGDGHTALQRAEHQVTTLGQRISPESYERIPADYQASIDLLRAASRQ